MFLISILLGIVAIIFTALNIISIFTNKNIKWFGFLGISFTALTLCAFINDHANLIINEEWSSLSDIVPTTSIACWILTAISIIINGICLWKATSK